jgi:excisionase family DNA binding protein
LEYVYYARKGISYRNPQEGTPQRLLLHIPEVAETLWIGRTNIYELIATRVLPTIRVGRAVRITDIVLQKWVEAREQQDVPISKKLGKKQRCLLQV